MVQAVGQGVTCQLDGGLKLELSHHPALVKFNRLRRDMQQPADLLRGIACRDEPQDLSLPLGQCAHAAFECRRGLDGGPFQRHVFALLKFLAVINHC